MGLGTGEIVLIILVVMIVFGASKLPQLGDGLGRAIRNFKRAVQGGSEIEVAAKKPEIDPSGRAEKTEAAGPGTPNKAP
ncbi:MAG: twin-arginine translocase TatA/TatE family subunit [Polyangia bacterium]|jgi:sec-independent protein translocase protein TatA